MKDFDQVRAHHDWLKFADTVRTLLTVKNVRPRPVTNIILFSSNDRKLFLYSLCTHQVHLN